MHCSRETHNQLISVNYIIYNQDFTLQWCVQSYLSLPSAVPWKVVTGTTPQPHLASLVIINLQYIKSLPISVTSIVHNTFRKDVNASSSQSLAALTKLRAQVKSSSNFPQNLPILHFHLQQFKSNSGSEAFHKVFHTTNNTWSFHSYNTPNSQPSLINFKKPTRWDSLTNYM